MNNLHSPFCRVSQSNSTRFHVIHHVKLKPIRVQAYLYNEFTDLQAVYQHRDTTHSSAGAVCDHRHGFVVLGRQCSTSPWESQGEHGEVPVWMQALGKEDRSLLIHRKSTEQTLNANLETTSNYKQVPAK